MKHKAMAKVGVAFSGGGIRGLAHLGVLQALEDMGLSVDLVAGTSMGGIVAGLYAAGIPLSDLIDFAKNTGIMDFASPDRAWRGLFSHKKMAAQLASLLGGDDLSFEDLQIPAAVMAVDLETRELIILDEGPLIPALLATSALPLLFSPVRHQGRWLVDGGALNNLPVDVVRHMGADRVLGVAVSTRLTLPLEAQEKEKGLSARGLLFFSNHTRDWKLPFLIAEASLGMTTQMINRARFAHCPPDLLLRIELANVGILTADENAAIIESGRKAAMGQVQDLLALQTQPPPTEWQKRMGRTGRRLRQAWAALRGEEPYLYPGETI